jgi:hypothetical protein
VKLYEARHLFEMTVARQPDILESCFGTFDYFEAPRITILHPPAMAAAAPLPCPMERKPLADARVPTALYAWKNDKAPGETEGDAKITGGSVLVTAT